MKDKNIAKKEKAIELLKEMDIYTPYIKGFEEKGLVCFLRITAVFGSTKSLNSMPR